MVKALLAGTKVQTRRIVNPPLHPLAEGFVRHPDGFAPIVAGYELGELPVERVRRCPYGQPGDLLWVRETWGYRYSHWRSDLPEICGYGIDYRADGGSAAFVLPDKPRPPGLPRQRDRGPGESEDHYLDYIAAYWRSWRPSIHMPKWAARLWLEIVEVRCERLQDISEEDAKAEGVEPLDWPTLDPAQPIIGHPEKTHASHPHTLAFAVAWDSINGDRALWSSDPFVWALTFRRTEAPQKEAA
jgi:hypothetical protein